jgi:replicative DNA helicase
VKVAAVAAAQVVSDLLREADVVLHEGRQLATRVPLGFTPLDAQIGHGLSGGDLAIVAGPQGVGKTSFALQAARNVAAAGQPATYVCYEHQPHQLLERLVVMEANLLAGDAAPTLEEVRLRLSRPGTEGLADRLIDLPGTGEALERVASYGDRLRIVGARGDVTSMEQIRAAAAWHEAAGLVVVDYLQKVHAADVDDEDVRVARIGTALKDLALETGQAVLAVSAIDRAGLDSRRVRARHLKGSVALAYEADVILVLQHKYDVISRDRLVFDLAGAGEHHHWIVLSVEKNRHGDDHVDLAFRKRLSRGLFDPVGHVEDDLLVDERVQAER